MRINKEVKGATFRNPVEENGGLTLFTTATDDFIYLIDMKGRIVHKWDVELKPVYKAELLTNGNLLYIGKKKNGPMDYLQDAAECIVELNWEGKKVWEYNNEYMHNTFYRKLNGNILFFQWEKLADEVKEKVKGGNPRYKNDVMWGDKICEINKKKRVIWEWKAKDHLNKDEHRICALDSNIEWTHGNSLYVSMDGNIVVNFMLTNTIVKIDPETKEVVWTWGPGETAHAHCITEPTFNKILFFDNGLHFNGLSPEFSRVFELNCTTKKIVWEYTENPFEYFYTSIFGSCQRLTNGNTLICDSDFGRLFEINRQRHIVWEYVNPVYTHGDKYSENNIITYAIRYNPDYPAFINKNWLV